DPDLVNYVIPCNDDAFKSTQIITHTIAQAVNEGRKQAEITAANKQAEKEKRREGRGRKRPRK
ncbi:MAG: 30S ribosomal protein S2, partial [Boseongicola sp. SB0664_bin_43]|nr:30S ribosomal protein S2 [Boseongicola sp. SB0664_bin_43]